MKLLLKMEACRRSHLHSDKPEYSITSGIMSMHYSLIFSRMIHSKIKHYGPLVARLLLALIFLVSAYGILTNFSATADFYAQIGIPLATLSVLLVLVVKIGGSLSIITGIHSRVGAWALIIFTLATIFVAHTSADQLMQALKNLAIVGGLLMIAVNGTGPLSMSHKCPCPKCKGGKTDVAGGVCNCGNCDECRAQGGEMN